MVLLQIIICRNQLYFLVASLIGRDRLFKLYDTAIDKNYRFYSYGDSMFIKNKYYEFKIISKNNNARAAELEINDKKIKTPAFMTIGTYGAVKTLDVLI